MKEQQTFSVVRSRSIKYTLNCQSAAEKKQVRDAFKRFPIIESAVSVIAAMDERTPWGVDIVRLAETIEAVNPRFPRDSFDVMTLVAMMKHEADLHAEEVKILLDLLPSKRDLRIKFRGSKQGAVLSFNFDYGNCYSEVSIINKTGWATAFPFTLQVRRWADMDDLDNHWEECPARNYDSLQAALDELGEGPEDAEERRKLEEALDECGDGSCDCEAEVQVDEQMEVTSELWDKKNGAKKVAEWIVKKLES